MVFVTDKAESNIKRHFDRIDIVRAYKTRLAIRKR